MLKNCKSLVYCIQTLLVLSLKCSICRSGVYCAANACIEQVIQHGEVIINCLISG